MPYVTRGTIQLTDVGNETTNSIRINPTEDYSVKHRDKRYLVLIEVPAAATAPNNARIVSLDDDFSFQPATLKDSLRIAAFKQTALELIISEVPSSEAATQPAEAAQPSGKYTVTQITIPATPSVFTR